MENQIKLANSAQKHLYSFMAKNYGLKFAQESLDKISKFHSYTQVRALKAGASIDDAPLFKDSLKLRALEAGITPKKALKTKNLEQVMHYENKAKPTSKISDDNNYKMDSKFHLVLDIDDVFCREIANSNSDYIINPQWIKSSFPESYLTAWMDHNIERTYFCFPNFDKLIAIVTSWKNWSISFFSAEESSRNIKVVTDYMSHKLGNEKFHHLIESRKLSIFSKENLAEEETNIPNVNRLAKNLKVIYHDIDNVILADDNPQNASNNQEQVIGLSIESSKKLINMMRTQDNQAESLKFNPLNNAAYILGILEANRHW